MRAKALTAAGAKLRVYDPKAMAEARPLLPDGVTFCDSAIECLKGAEAAVVVTEWNEFRALNPKYIVELMKGNTIIDLRNIFDPKEMSDARVNYFSLGRK